MAVRHGSEVTQYNTPSKPLHSDGSVNCVKCKRILQVLTQTEQEHLVYEGVTYNDYIYIIGHLEDAECQKTRHRLTFFPYTECLMASTPLPAHESILCVVRIRLGSILESIPVSGRVYFDIRSAALVRKDSIIGVPDGLVKIWSECNATAQRILLMEAVFSQTDDQVMNKLRDYVHNEPDLLLACKIVFKQVSHYHSPRRRTARQLQASRVMMESKWNSSVGDAEFTRVVVGGHKWFAVSSVQIHVWIRQPGDSDINLDLLDSNYYGFGTLYPAVDLSDVNRVFQCSLALVKNAVMAELPAGIVDTGVEEWSPPDHLLDAGTLQQRLVMAAKETAYERYCRWHTTVSRG
ncbi:hypothetical protein SCLCIDRAFT_23975 [Scleroderma citrinum Foug A]|uniref:Uncharacterized protein n=1 Tax=Scleroderma citrinum Foug A TaxID=1036808 RepID=A0A0C3AFU9_9AGAM|nr:hypothetical protein SCLCIDRAFT_23975 [Scleroderma citrinum Foug A]